MSSENDEGSLHRIKWRELSRNVPQREILYYIAGSPDGAREPKVKSYMQDVFKYSFQGSVEGELKKLEADGLLTKESPKRGAPVWHANHTRVIEMIQDELEVVKGHEFELRDLLTYLKEVYG